MTLESKPNRSRQWEDELGPEDLEWLEQQIQQQTGEDCSEGRKEQTAGPSLDPLADPLGATPATYGEEHRKETDLSAIRKERGDLDPSPTSPEQQPQRVEQETGEGCNGAPADPTEGPLPPSPANPSTPATCGEEHPPELLPEIRKEAGEVDPSPTSPGKQPQLNRLLVSQLGASVPQWLSHPEHIHDAIELYRRFDPQDGIEIVLSALTVSLFNASMDGLDRAARPGLKPEVRQMELRLSQSGTAQVTSLIKTLQAQRGLGTHKVNVGSVNVSSGANAIVGNVAGRRADKD
jgi:hypothetical protein